MTEEKFKKLFAALETVFPELANGQKILEVHFTELEPARFETLPEEFISKMRIDFTYGYRASGVTEHELNRAFEQAQLDELDKYLDDEK